MSDEMPEARMITVGGHDPACLHCRVAMTVRQRATELQAAGGLLQSVEVLGALARLAGEIIAQAPEPLRGPMLQHTIAALSSHAGYAARLVEDPAEPIGPVH